MGTARRQGRDRHRRRARHRPRPRAGAGQARRRGGRQRPRRRRSPATAPTSKAADLTVELIDRARRQGGGQLRRRRRLRAAPGAWSQQAVDTYGPPRRAREQRRHRARQRHLEHGRGRLRRGDPGAPQGHVAAVPPRRQALAGRGRKAGEVFTGRVINTDLGRRPGRQLRPDQLRHGQGRASPASPRRCRSSSTSSASPSTPSARPPPRASPARCPTRPAVIEADDVPDDEWNRMDPAVSSPLVAWLASDESQHVTGQVIRAVAEDIVWMQGWTDGPDDLQRRQALGRREARPAARHRRLRDPGARPALLERAIASTHSC